MQVLAQSALASGQPRLVPSQHMLAGAGNCPASPILFRQFGDDGMADCDVVGVAELILRIMSEAEETLKRLGELS